MTQLFELLHQRIMTFDTSLNVYPTTRYTAYRKEPEMTRQFVSIITRHSHLIVRLCVTLEKIHDPRNLCEVGKGRWDVHAIFDSAEQLDDIMYLVKQTYRHNL